MTSSQWILILALAFAAFGLRFTGLIAGARLQRSRFAPLLDELPGLIVISLVASSLAGQPVVAWFAAGVAALVALFSNNIILTMIVGVTVFATLTHIGEFTVIP